MYKKHSCSNNIFFKIYLFLTGFYIFFIFYWVQIQLGKFYEMDTLILHCMICVCSNNEACEQENEALACSAKLSSGSTCVSGPSCYGFYLDSEEQWKT